MACPQGWQLKSRELCIVAWKAADCTVQACCLRQLCMAVGFCQPEAPLPYVQEGPLAAGVPLT